MTYSRFENVIDLAKYMLLLQENDQLRTVLRDLRHEVQAYGLTNPGSETLLAAMDNARVVLAEVDKVPA